MNISKSVFVAASLLLVAGTALRAQESRARVLELAPPPTTLGSNSVSSASQAWLYGSDGDADLGPQIMLLRKKSPQMMQLFSDSQYLYDSNVDLVPHGAVGDAIFFQTLGAAFTPPLIDYLTSTVYVRQQFVRYNNNSSLDFNAETAGLSLSYPVKKWFTLYGGFDATQLTDRNNNNAFQKEYDTQFGLWRSDVINRRLGLFYGYQMDWLPTSPSSLTQVDDALYAGANVLVCDKVIAQVLLRTRNRFYLQASRTDWDQLAGLTVTYTFNRFIGMRVYSTFAYNQSNQSEFDYHVGSAGGGLNLTLKF